MRTQPTQNSASGATLDFVLTHVAMEIGMTVADWSDMWGGTYQFITDMVIVINHTLRLGRRAPRAIVVPLRSIRQGWRQQRCSAAAAAEGAAAAVRHLSAERRGDAAGASGRLRRDPGQHSPEASLSAAAAAHRCWGPAHPEAASKRRSALAGASAQASQRVRERCASVTLKIAYF